MNKNAKSDYLVINLSAWEHSELPSHEIQRLIETVPERHRAAAVCASYVVSHTARYPAKCSRLLHLTHHSGLTGGWKVIQDSGEQLLSRFPLCPSSWVDFVQFDDPNEFLWVCKQP